MELRNSTGDYYGQRPHVLVVAFPSPGHTIPLMQLSIRLASKGVRISFVNTENYLSSMLQTPQAGGSSYYPHVLGLDNFHFLGIPDRLPKGLPINPSTYVEYFKAIDKLGPVLEPLVEKIMTTESPVSCIISDCFLPWTQKVANRFGIPRIAFWTTCAAVFSLRLHTPKFVENGVFPCKAETRSSEDLITGIPGLPPLHPHELPEDLVVEEISNFNFQFTQRQLENINESVLVLVNTFFALESIVFDAVQPIFPKVLPLGPLLPFELLHDQGALQIKDNAMFSSEDDNICLEWLGMKPPLSVLYVAFGSLADLTPSQSRHLAIALESSQQPFLWVIRHNSSEESVSDGLPSGFLSRTKQRGLCVSWVPQLRVLSHPSVGAFLTHCGWNSIIEGICWGVPLIGFPCFSDQRINCRLMVHEWQIGMEFKPGENGEVESEEITRVIQLMMHGKEGELIRKRATELRNAARSAAENGGTSANNLNVLIDYIERTITAQSHTAT